MTLPIKSLDEIEVKAEVSVNDKILILDSESEEARLASKDELKWDKGDQWDPWTPWADGKDWEDGAAATVSVWTTSTLPAWSDATVNNSGTSSDAVLNFGIPKGDQWDPWTPWADWADGNWITSVTSSKEWKITTVTMNFDEWDPFSFQVQDWADGQGAGDVLWPSSSTDWDVVLFDWITWKLIKDSWKTLPTQASDVNALPSSTKYWASISVSINTTDYKVTTTLKDQDGNTLGNAQVIDLPLESVVVNGSYDSQTKKVILTLQNGNTIEFSVADLVSGLQSEITAQNKLESDLVDDTNQTNKFVTASDKTTWDGKQDALTLPSTPTNWHLVAWWSDNKTLTDWWAIPTGVPSWWTDWQVLSKVSGNIAWANPSWWHSTITVTLTSAWWSSNSQTVSATGVTATNDVIVSPAPTDIADYADCGVYCSAQGSGTLTFGCDSTPSGDIVVNVLIFS